MDTISNVLAGYFDTAPATSMTLLRAMTDAVDPRRGPTTFREIFRDVDPEQVIAVTGEEDNQFVPSGGARSGPGPVRGVAETPVSASADEATAEDAPQDPPTRDDDVSFTLSLSGTLVFMARRPGRRGSSRQHGDVAVAR